MWGSIAGLEQHEVNQIMERALAAGINFIDTADVYSIGQSEKLLGQSLKDLGIHRKDVVIATKVHGPMGAGPNDQGRKAERRVGEKCVSMCRSRGSPLQ